MMFAHLVLSFPLPRPPPSSGASTFSFVLLRVPGCCSLTVCLSMPAALCAVCLLALGSAPAYREPHCSTSSFSQPPGW